MELKCGEFRHWSLHGLRSNRTFMELKYYPANERNDLHGRSNRTFMELKSGMVANEVRDTIKF